MGKEETIKKAKQALGKYNVHIKVYYNSLKETDHTHDRIEYLREEFDCKSWTPGPGQLALDFEDRLEVIVLANVRKYVISKQTEENPEEIV